MCKTSIIIVTYRDKQEMLGCVKTISSQKTKSTYEIILVDNGGDRFDNKRVKSICSDFTYIKSLKNLGYGGGNNLGIKNTRGKYVYILNPDTRLLPNSIDPLVKFLEENNNVAVVSPVLVDSDGKVIKQISAKLLTPIRQIFSYTFVEKIFPNNQIRKEFLDEDVNSKKPYEVEVVPGSAFMIRKSVFDEVGQFDENLFLYFEENDLGIRLKDKGYKLYKIPNSKIIHDWHEAEGNKKTKKIFEKSRFYYFKKHFGLNSAIIVEAFSRKWWKFS